MGTQETILILQIGSLGDTVISIPCYREIARRHPNSDRLLLTNYPIGSKMVPAAAILQPIGLIDGCIEYPMPLREPRQMVQLYRAIKARKPDVLYYLLPEVHRANLLRHVLFFKACGIPKIRGIPWSVRLQFPLELQPGRLWESEASRLLRTIGAPGGPAPSADRDLCLSHAERMKAQSVIAEFAPRGFITMSVGGKVPINNWGDENWRATLSSLSGLLPSFGVVFIGSADERARNEQLATAWPGPTLNTCGQLTPRETAALIEKSSAFVGHDTGTLHLAAAVDTPVVGIFSARNRPGKWFSDRARDVFFYDHVACAGCELVAIKDCPYDRRCLAGHRPAKIAKAVAHLALSRAMA